jgi:hypothetical protein
MLRDSISDSELMIEHKQRFLSNLMLVIRKKIQQVNLIDNKGEAERARNVTLEKVQSR